ncbi:galactonate dehydratase [Agromyces silvae]|uniref:galactonate dehydratase n=1 Tax=Agromyces silvae TaxID=3388266 RepID=UPI00280C3DD8|nr:galactonate dehydratase [Agromyces protaetiae]
MRITSVETFPISDRQLLVKISTDAGIAGWGEPTLETWTRPVAATVEQMAEYLIGKDPRQINRHWQVLTRGGFYRGGPVMGSAVAGLDQAMWDLLGKSLGAPVHELLGGAVRDAIRLYAHANTDDRLGDPARAAALLRDGWTMVKLVPYLSAAPLETPGFTERLVSDLRELRTVVGAEVDLAVDLHGRLSLAQSRRFLDATADLGLVFVEEPLRPEHTGLVGRLTSATATPIALGERLYSRAEFLPALTAGVTVVQPDVSHAGGISEAVRIAAMSEPFDALLAPHCPLGIVAFAACVQVDAVAPNFLAQECIVSFDGANPDTDLSFLLNPDEWMPRDGYLPLPTRPGLGLEIDEAAVRDAARHDRTDPGVRLWWSDPRDQGYREW